MVAIVGKVQNLAPLVLIIVFILVDLPLALLKTVLGQIKLTAQNWMKALLGQGFRKGRNGKKDPVVRDSTRSHAKLHQAVRQVIDPDGPVQKAVFRMEMKMGKSHRKPPLLAVQQSFDLFHHLIDYLVKKVLSLGLVLIIETKVDFQLRLGPRGANGQPVDILEGEN